MASHTQRTIKLLENQGFKTWNVELWNSFSRRKTDLFGIIDRIAIRPGQIVGVQICGSDFQPHVRKITESEYTVPWLESGALLWLIGWRKVLKKRGGKQRIYRPRFGVFTAGADGVFFHEEKTEEEREKWLRNNCFGS